MADTEGERKLSNKERRALKKAQDVAEIQETTEEVTDSIAQFSVTQAGSGEVSALAALSNDIKIDSFSISARGTSLFEDASLSIVAGRHVEKHSKNPGRILRC